MKIDENGNVVNEAPEVSMDELQDFISDVEISDTAPTDAPEVTPSLDTPAEEKPSGEEPAKEVTSEVVVQAEVLTVPDTPTSEVDPRDAQIAALTELVNKLSGGTSTPTPEVKPESANLHVKAPPVEIPSLDSLLETVDFDAIMEDKAKFVEFFKSAMSAVREDTVQRTLTNIPQVVGTFVQRQATLKDIATEFYGAHPELKRVKPFVSHTANAVAAEHADWNIAQVLNEAAIRVKEALQLKGEVVEAEKVAATKPKPSLPGGSQGAKGPGKPSSGLQSEIDDLIND